MKTKPIVIKDFRKVATLLKDKNFEGKIHWGKYVIHKNTRNQTVNQRVQKLYNQRRDEGRCIRCGKLVRDINYATGEKYRMCKEHR